MAAEAAAASKSGPSGESRLVDSLLAGVSLGQGTDRESRESNRVGLPVRDIASCRAVQCKRH